MQSTYGNLHNFHNNPIKWEQSLYTQRSWGHRTMKWWSRDVKLTSLAQDILLLVSLLKGGQQTKLSSCLDLLWLLVIFWRKKKKKLNILDSTVCLYFLFFHTQPTPFTQCLVLKTFGFWFLHTSILPLPWGNFALSPHFSVLLRTPQVTPLSQARLSLLLLGSFPFLWIFCLLGVTVHLTSLGCPPTLCWSLDLPWGQLRFCSGPTPVFSCLRCPQLSELVCFLLWELSKSFYIFHRHWVCLVVWI